MSDEKTIKYRGVDCQITNHGDYLSISINGIQYKYIERIGVSIETINSKCFFKNNLILSAKHIEKFTNNTDECYAYDFKDSIFNGNLVISNQNVNQPTEGKNYTKSYTKISKPLFISFNNVVFEQNLEIIIGNENVEPKEMIDFKGCYFGKKFKIRNTELQLKNKHTDRGLETKNSVEQRNKLKIKQFLFQDCNVGENAYLRFGFLEVKDFRLSNLRLPQNAELNIGDCHFHKFQLSNFRNVGKFKLYKINILKGERAKQQNPKFQIDNTSIGKSNLQSVSLTSFAVVKMYDNIFAELDYSNVKWKEAIEVGQLNSNNTEADKKRDTYRTLKNVASRNNDQPQAIKFFAKEMEYHQKIVSGNKEYSLSDRATLWFNKHTNGFGLSFWKPLAWLLFFSVVFYSFLICSFDDGYHSRYWTGIFDFFNPTHKTQFINAHHWNGWSYLWDFLFRIIEGLLIYQTIQAFRKYSRKL